MKKIASGGLRLTPLVGSYGRNHVYFGDMSNKNTISRRWGLSYHDHGATFADLVKIVIPRGQQLA